MKLSAALSLLLTAIATVASAKTDWNRFRGPNGSGYVETTGLPTAVTEDTTVPNAVAADDSESAPAKDPLADAGVVPELPAAQPSAGPTAGAHAGGGNRPH